MLDDVVVVVVISKDVDDDDGGNDDDDIRNFSQKFRIIKNITYFRRIYDLTNNALYTYLRTVGTK